MLRHLRELLEMIGMKVAQAQVNVARAPEAFDDAGNLVRPEDRAAVRELVDELVRAVRPVGVRLSRLAELTAPNHFLTGCPLGRAR